MYPQAELEEMTVTKLKSLSADLGYTITKTKKEDIIKEFLEQQG